MPDHLDPEADLAQRVARISSVFDPVAVAQRDYRSTYTTRAYYRATRLAYRVVHSRAGYMHMGISRDQTHKPEDLQAQADLTAKYIAEASGHPDGRDVSVLELATGNGSNLEYLASKHHDQGFTRARFTGMDLSARAAARKLRALRNVTVLEGDYHDLSSQDTEQHHVAFVFEALCYSEMKETVFAEANRVLKPGGFFVIADGYRGKERFTPLEEHAGVLLERGMAVGGTSETYPAVMAKPPKKALLSSKKKM